ncbi:MAG TPA: VOC family protein [Pyrinomonadaceae bacterium]|nr:VOC family protein [Pyrinomonadaceae bacterium]
MECRLEHANLNVRDVEAMIRFLKTAFPEFRVRREGKCHGIRWVHVGTDNTYIVLNPTKADSERHWIPYSGEPGVNHLAYEVDDVASLRARLKAAGYRESTVPNAHPHRKRVYFYDPEGNDWEFIQYFSQDPAERNDYELPDS